MTSKVLKSALIAVILISSTGLTACGGKKLTPNLIAPVSTTPATDTLLPEPTPDYGYNDNAATAPVQAAPNAQIGSFLVDQATFINDWQAKGIAVAGGSIYLSASDTKGLSKKGTIIKMNSSDGKGWKDLGSKYLGISHPIAATVEGITISGGSIIAVGAAGVYTVDASSGSIKTVKSAGGKDVTSGAGSIYIASGTLEKTDASASSRVPLTGVPSVTGGVGSDNLGNVYVVSGTTIKKADTTGNATDVITSDLSNPIDVAVDSRAGDIYVLDANMIKRFNGNGQLLATFSSGATKPVSIAVDEAGAVYIADWGTTNKDSKVLKFAAALADSNNMSASGGGYGDYSSSGSGYNYGNSSSGSGDYSTYSSTKKPTTTTTNPRKK